MLLYENLSQESAGGADKSIEVLSRSLWQTSRYVFRRTVIIKESEVALQTF
jgi:hypothetical protein